MVREILVCFYYKGSLMTGLIGGEYEKKMLLFSIIKMIFLNDY